MQMAEIDNRIKTKKPKRKKDRKSRRNKHKYEDVTSLSEDDDLDLTKELHPLAHYLGDYEELVTQLFTCVGVAKLDSMLPPVLKGIPSKELKRLCLHELCGMSKKRIMCVINGHEMVGSSGSEEDEEDSMEEKSEKYREGNTKNKRNEEEKLSSPIKKKKTAATHSKKGDSEVEENAGEFGRTPLEMLELQMRARIIKTMLEKRPSEEGEDVPPALDEGTGKETGEVWVGEAKKKGREQKAEMEVIVVEDEEKMATSRDGVQGGSERARLKEKKKITRREFKERMKRAKMNRSYRSRNGEKENKAKEEFALQVAPIERESGAEEGEKKVDASEKEEGEIGSSDDMREEGVYSSSNFSDYSDYERSRHRRNYDSRRSPSLSTSRSRSRSISLEKREAARSVEKGGKVEYRRGHYERDLNQEDKSQAVKDRGVVGNTKNAPAPVKKSQGRVSLSGKDEDDKEENWGENCDIEFVDSADEADDGKKKLGISFAIQKKIVPTLKTTAIDDMPMATRKHVIGTDEITCPAGTKSTVPEDTVSLDVEMSIDTDTNQLTEAKDTSLLIEASVKTNLESMNSSLDMFAPDSMSSQNSTSLKTDVVSEYNTVVISNPESPIPNDTKSVLYNLSDSVIDSNDVGTASEINRGSSDTTDISVCESSFFQNPHQKEEILLHSDVASVIIQENSMYPVTEHSDNIESGKTEFAMNPKSRHNSEECVHMVTGEIKSGELPMELPSKQKFWEPWLDAKLVGISNDAVILDGNIDGNTQVPSDVRLVSSDKDHLLEHQETELKLEPESHLKTDLFSEISSDKHSLNLERGNNELNQGQQVETLFDSEVIKTNQLVEEPTGCISPVITDQLVLSLDSSHIETGDAADNAQVVDGESLVVESEEVDDFYRGADQLTFTEELPQEEVLVRFDGPVEPLRIETGLIRKRVLEKKRVDQPYPEKSWAGNGRKRRSQKSGTIAPEGVGHLCNALAEKERSIDVSGVGDFGRHSGDNYESCIADSEPRSSQSSITLETQFIDSVEPESSLVGAAGDDSNSWSSRWLQSDKVQKVVSSSKVLSRVRNKIKKERGSASRKTTVCSPSGDATAVTQIVSEPTVPVIGSIEEYEKMFGIKVKVAEVQSEQSTMTLEKVLEKVDKNPFEIDSDEDSEEEALWSKIMGN